MDGMGNVAQEAAGWGRRRSTSQLPHHHHHHHHITMAPELCGEAKRTQPHDWPAFTIATIQLYFIVCTCRIFLLAALHLVPSELVPTKHSSSLVAPYLHNSTVTPPINAEYLRCVSGNGSSAAPLSAHFWIRKRYLLILLDAY